MILKIAVKAIAVVEAAAFVLAAKVVLIALRLPYTAEVLLFFLVKVR